MLKRFGAFWCRLNPDISAATLSFQTIAQRYPRFLGDVGDTIRIGSPIPLKMGVSLSARTNGDTQRFVTANTKILITIMTQSREPNDRDIFTRIAALEYQVTEIQNTQAQLRATIAPGGYVTDAFERVVDRISEVEERLNARMDERFAEVNRRFDSQDAKFDTILRHITGMGNS
jgi:translation initiation factor 1 (eIF-1/SUI1)